MLDCSSCKSTSKLRYVPFSKVVICQGCFEKTYRTSVDAAEAGEWWPYLYETGGWALQNNQGETSYVFPDMRSAATACRALNAYAASTLNPHSNTTITASGGTGALKINL